MKDFEHRIRDVEASGNQIGCFFFSRESKRLTPVHSFTPSVIYKPVASRTGTQGWIRHSLCLPQATQRPRMESQVLDLREPQEALTLPYHHSNQWCVEEGTGTE